MGSKEREIVQREGAQRIKRARKVKRVRGERQVRMEEGKRRQGEDRNVTGRDFSGR